MAKHDTDASKPGLAVISLVTNFVRVLQICDMVQYKYSTFDSFLCDFNLICILVE